MRPASGARLICQASATTRSFRFPPSDFWFCSFTANSPKLRISSLSVVCIGIHWASRGPTLWDSTCSWAILRRPVETCLSCGFWMGFCGGGMQLEFIGKEKIWWELGTAFNSTHQVSGKKIERQKKKKWRKFEKKKFKGMDYFYIVIQIHLTYYKN